jgi:HD-GYP domain-containing protein (c-di-GMP phosphodiesterase class II)
VHAPWKAGALVGGTIAIGFVIVTAAVVQGVGAPLGMLALFAAGVVLTELFQVPGDDNSLDPADQHWFSFSSGVHVAAVIVLGPWPAALVAVFGVVIVDGLRGSAVQKVAYNSSVFALAVVTAGYAFTALGGVPGTLELPADFAALGGLLVTAYVVNSLFVNGIVALASSSSFWPLARDTVRSDAASAAAEFGLGVTLAFVVLHEPWAVVALVPLVLAVYSSYERLATLRRETARSLETFANVVDERDISTFQHSARVADYVRDLAEALDLPASVVSRLRWAGRLHDLGKIAVDAAVLRKPGKLDEEEWAAMRRHARLSARLLRRFRLATNEARAVEYHHERFDGRGYYGIDASDIPFAAHFLIVADSYDAMTSDRAYRRGLPSEHALAEIEANAGSQFHPVVAKAFVALQRGLDPREVLTAEERHEIQRALKVRPRRPLRAELAVRAEIASALAVSAAVAALAFGAPLVAVPLFVFAAGGFAHSRIEDLRARRLAGSLGRALEEAASPDAAFSAVRGELARTGRVGWIGLVSWRETECTGQLERAWSGAEPGPTETALASWLLRDSESATGLVAATGNELGRRLPHVAVPLRREGAVAGYLVVALRPGTRRVEQALAAEAEELADTLLARRPTELSHPALRVVAG